MPGHGHGHFHLSWTFNLTWPSSEKSSCMKFSPHMGISPCMATFILCGHFHLVCTQDHFLRFGGCPLHNLKSHLMWTLLPHVGIFTLCRYFNLTWPFFTWCGYFHLTWPFSLHMSIFTSCGQSHITRTFAFQPDILTLHGHFHLV